MNDGPGRTVTELTVGVLGECLLVAESRNRGGDG